ncbi:MULTISPECIES: hypothetical protein [unclassified Rickettsia]
MQQRFWSLAMTVFFATISIHATIPARSQIQYPPRAKIIYKN